MFHKLVHPNKGRHFSDSPLFASFASVHRFRVLQCSPTRLSWSVRRCSSCCLVAVGLDVWLSLFGRSPNVRVLVWRQPALRVAHLRSIQYLSSVNYVRIIWYRLCEHIVICCPTEHLSVQLSYSSIKYWISVRMSASDLSAMRACVATLDIGRVPIWPNCSDEPLPRMQKNPTGISISRRVGMRHANATVQ